MTSLPRTFERIYLTIAVVGCVALGLNYGRLFYPPLLTIYLLVVPFAVGGCIGIGAGHYVNARRQRKMHDGFLLLPQSVEFTENEDGTWTVIVSRLNGDITTVHFDEDPRTREGFLKTMSLILPASEYDFVTVALEDMERQQRAAGWANVEENDRRRREDEDV